MALSLFRRSALTLRWAALGILGGPLAAALAAPALSPWVGEAFWQLGPGLAVTWPVQGETRLPHGDNLEMSGRRVSAMIDYAVDPTGHVAVTREVIFPQLRVFPSQDSPDWFRYRAYLRATYTDEALPRVLLDERTVQLPPAAAVQLDGTLRVRHQPTEGVTIERRWLPSMHERLLVEHWKLTNAGATARRVQLLPVTQERHRAGPEGRYRLLLRSLGPAAEQTLAPGESFDFAVYFEALAEGEQPSRTAWDDVIRQREQFIQEVTGQLRFGSPDAAINTLFAFSKIRAAECLFDSALGLIHSPSGGNYYVGIWANDQAEYSGPFFPYLGYAPGVEAALNAYEAFRRVIPSDGGAIWSSLEMEGTLPCCGKDRGDAAMLAYGAAHFALATGRPEVGRQLWPLIEWGLDYSHRRLNAAGVVESQTDEMEGRIPTGSANLSTSSLYYAALRHAADLARALGHEATGVKQLEARAERLAQAIEAYFGAEIDGLRTYRYFEGHRALRHWIGLPLAVDLAQRRDDTVTALFDRMWTTHGVRVEVTPGTPNVDLFWDRGTLYALRGAFRTGATELALDRLRQFTATRLTGFRVPYVIEAWPENNMRHLSAESALYCRVVTEALLGLVPTAFDQFRLRPRLPAAWRQDGYVLEQLRLFGRDLNVRVSAGNADRVLVEVTESGRSILRRELADGEEVEVRLLPVSR